MNYCKFCNKECKNSNSLSNHQLRCRCNPDRKVQTGRKGSAGKIDGNWQNAATKARAAGVAYVVSENTRQKLSNASSKRKHSEESKRLISDALKGNRNANHRGDRQSYYKGIRMDSSWEVKTAQYLDDNNVVWTYSEKGFRLSDGRYYYPDFFIYENDKFVKLIEVKGYFREANKKKFEMFLKEYPEIVTELWMKGELLSRGII